VEQFRREGGPVLTGQVRRAVTDPWPWDAPAGAEDHGEPPGWLDPGGPGPESLDPASYTNPDRFEEAIEF
jgi:hypothetical protein